LVQSFLPVLPKRTRDINGHRGPRNEEISDLGAIWKPAFKDPPANVFVAKPMLSRSRSHLDLLGPPLINPLTSNVCGPFLQSLRLGGVYFVFCVLFCFSHQPRPRTGRTKLDKEIIVVSFETKPARCNKAIITELARVYCQSRRDRTRRKFACKGAEWGV